MPDIELVFADNGDWMGVYKDGYLAYEGNGIEPDELLYLCTTPYRARFGVPLENGDRLPPLLHRVPGR